MKINFINHASVIFDCGDVKILTDPWYTGKVFNNGWSLIVDNETDINDLDFNYLWFSHEHPDHFNVPDIKKIKEDRRKDITILFQKTEDQKVKKFCENLGFKVIELWPHEFYNILDVKICCNPVKGFDSWLYINHAGQGVLNANDCRLEDEDELNELKEYLPNIDVLMTQFGWANWVGNDGDAESRDKARELLAYRIKNQIDILRPKFIVPFASFCWFSHEENWFCNIDGVTIDEFIATYPNQNIVVLYPEDTWKLSEGMIDSSSSVKKWREAYDKIKYNPKNLTKSISVSMDSLKESFKLMTKHLSQNNDWDSVLQLKDDGLLESSVIYLIDLDECVIFDITEPFLMETFKRPPMPTRGCADIHMSSESLKYLMDYGWGRGTLMVNGRFSANYDTLYRFLRQTRIYYGNNIGQTYPKDITREEIEFSNSFVSQTLD